MVHTPSSSSTRPRCHPTHDGTRHDTRRLSGVFSCRCVGVLATARVCFGMAVRVTA
jgi:hypothetical protein